MAKSNKALRDLFDIVHRSEESVDMSLPEADEIGPDDDEDHGPELFPEPEPGMMSNEGFDDLIGGYFANKRRGESSTVPLVEPMR